MCVCVFDYIMKKYFFCIILLGSFQVFPDRYFGFRVELVDEFTEIIPGAFGPLIGHHQGLFLSVNLFFKNVIFAKFCKNYVNL